MVLIFGHTVGHAIEKATGFTNCTHGEAVAVGMVTAAAIGEQLGLTEAGTGARIKSLLGNYRLPISVPLPASALLEAIRSDKKRLAGRIYFVLLRSVGEAFLLPMEPAELERVLAEVWVHG